MESGLLRQMTLRGNFHTYLTTPSIEIAAGIYDKLDSSARILQQSEASQRALCESVGIYTVKRLYNLLMTASVPLPTHLIHDESHHSVDNTHETLWAITGNCPRVGFTATDYRGTPQETMKLRTAWANNIYTALTLKEATDSSVVAAPSWDVWPLVNDELIAVKNGEFDVRAVQSAMGKALPDIVDRIEPYYDRESRLWDRPSMIAVTSVDLVRTFLDAFRTANLPAVGITGEGIESAAYASNLMNRGRQGAFEDVVNRRAVLVQIKVVGEGVDLPIRRLWDFAPTMSPVLWMQRVGRITRPTDDPPEYITCCHNLMRHGYLWHGVIPPAAMKMAQTVWGPNWKPSRRTMARALGLEGFGKFVTSPIPLADETFANLYALQTKDGLSQYAVLLHPLHEEPMYFTRRNELTGEQGTFEKNGYTISYTKKQYGKWNRVPGLPDMEGCASIKPDAITPNMERFWKNAAGSRGLLASHTPNSREFQALPILLDAKLRFR